MKSYGDDLLNTERTLGEVEKLTKTVIDANEKSTEEIIDEISKTTKELKEQHGELLAWLGLVEEKQHRFRLFVLSGLGVTVTGLIVLVGYTVASHLSLL